MTDYMFVCPTRHAVNYYVNMADNNGEVKKWVYIFDQPLADHGIEKYKYCVGYACEYLQLLGWFPPDYTCNFWNAYM